MFYLYVSIVSSLPLAPFSDEAEAIKAARRWFAGNGWIVRTTPTHDFFKA